MNDQRPIASLRLHPDAQRVPLPDHADLRALRESLRDNGQEDPIDVTDDGVILDGRTRWTLLQELGAESIRVRVQSMPEAQQTAYIIDRALARRHLTMRQKCALNDLLRVQVIEERPTRRGNVMRLGHSQTERAAKLGVERETVKRWDAEAHDVGTFVPTSPLPTHAIDASGRPQPLRHLPSAEMPARSDKKGGQPGRTPSTPKAARLAPVWGRHFTRWCRSVLPEDKPYLVQMSDELHKALALLGLDCATGRTE